MTPANKGHVNPHFKSKYADLASVWDANVDPFSNIVRMTVMKLRRKLGEPALIHTVPGAGYRI